MHGTGRTLEFYGDRDAFSHVQREAWLLAQLDARNTDVAEGMFFGHNLPMEQRLSILHEVVCKLKSDHVLSRLSSGKGKMAYTAAEWSTNTLMVLISSPIQ